MSKKFLKIMCYLVLGFSFYSCGDDKKDSDPETFLSSCENTWSRNYSMFSIPTDWVVQYVKSTESDTIEQKYKANQQGDSIAINISEDEDDTETINTSKAKFLAQCDQRQHAYKDQGDQITDTTLEGKNVLHVKTTITHDLAQKIIAGKDDSSEFATALSAAPADTTVNYIADISYDFLIINETLYFESSGTKYTNSYKASKFNN